MFKLKTTTGLVIVKALGMIKKGAEGGKELINVNISPLFWVFLLTMIEP